MALAVSANRLSKPTVLWNQFRRRMDVCQRIHAAELLAPIHSWGNSGDLLERFGKMVNVAEPAISSDIVQWQAGCAQQLLRMLDT